MIARREATSRKACFMHLLVAPIHPFLICRFALRRWKVSSISSPDDLSEIFSGAKLFDVNGTKTWRTPGRGMIFTNVRVKTESKPGERDIEYIEPGELDKAVKLWLEDKTCAEAYYGHIKTWNVSEVKDMRRLFASTEFHDDISGWDVSSVEDMSEMFYFAEKFNHDVGKWAGKVRNVKDMTKMFYEAKAFRHDLSEWDVSGVERVDNFKEMFTGATGERQ